MGNTIDMDAIGERIARMKAIAGEVESLSTDFPALVSNIRRIQASIKMLELNVSDLEYPVRRRTG